MTIIKAILILIVGITLGHEIGKTSPTAYERGRIEELLEENKRINIQYNELYDENKLLKKKNELLSRRIKKMKKAQNTETIDEEIISLCVDEETTE